MFNENKILNKILGIGRKIIPKRLFGAAQPLYHMGLSMFGAIIYGFPSRAMKVIAVTGTKGKSTTVYMISRIFEEQGSPVAAVGSLGFKIREKEWPNTLKMTLPGRMKLQKFLHLAKKAGVKYVALEATSEGIEQNRLAGVTVDCAVFTNLHREHLESHGSFENYMSAKQKLFLNTGNIQVLNIDDPYFEKFANFPARHKITYGKNWGMITSDNLRAKNEKLSLELLGEFNEYNALAALASAYAYNLDMDKAISTINSIKSVPGRMEIVRASAGFDVIIDYAHTPDSLELVYGTLKNKLDSSSAVLGSNTKTRGRLICVLGAAGGGRDKWKRSEFGKIAARYCDEIILTDEDPYDEDPETIMVQIASGFPSNQKFLRVIDRREAIKKALSTAGQGDLVVITGKGSEISMAVAGGKKIPWSDKKIVEEFLFN
ncbi:MAG: UDP-N-acetylmuramoyl-L-alanyl-D-glutamate--2,6-diaminopimelate ligase [Candidatus Yanofskybacteria bacterium]|nr:UDP-N-acetylmuramoyl-L-alanyl-D-glutamate--2,6-diaminopimelate ligase [Candidatus Yanofskybacteria bacterium]